MKLRQTELSKKCKAFVVAHWGKGGLKQISDKPVSWVRYQANPYLSKLRPQGKNLPLIAVHGRTNRIHVALSTE